MFAFTKQRETPKGCVTMTMSFSDQWEKKTCFKWKILVLHKGELSEIFSSMWTLKTLQHICLITWKRMKNLYPQEASWKQEIQHLWSCTMEFSYCFVCVSGKSYSQRSLCTYSKSHDLLYIVKLNLGLSYQWHL